MIKKDKKTQDLLDACGNSSKAMRTAARKLRECGLDAYANMLEKAQTELNDRAIVHYDDTQPIELES